jgi:NAD(P)-dependent dehydrogenase (short-subunit alcohol dehydrogenase family)
MKEFAGRIAVVTGGGSGMRRELVRQLVAEACNVSMCDLAAEGMAETMRLCEAAGLSQGLRVTTHIADVSDFAQMERFRAEVADRHATERIHLLFNNALIRKASGHDSTPAAASPYGPGRPPMFSGAVPWPERWRHGHRVGCVRHHVRHVRRQT